MPRKKAEKEPPPFKWLGYKNIHIPEIMRESAQAFCTDEKNVWFSFNQLLIKGYTVKVYFDKKQESFKCTLTCQSHEEANFGYAMSSYAGDWYTSLAICIYKHYELADEDWSSIESKASKSFG